MPLWAKNDQQFVFNFVCYAKFCVNDRMQLHPNMSDIDSYSGISSDLFMDSYTDIVPDANFDIYNLTQHALWPFFDVKYTLA